MVVGEYYKKRFNETVTIIAKITEVAKDIVRTKNFHVNDNNRFSNKYYNNVYNKKNFNTDFKKIDQTEAEIIDLLYGN